MAQCKDYFPDVYPIHLVNAESAMKSKVQPKKAQNGFFEFMKVRKEEQNFKGNMKELAATLDSEWRTMTSAQKKRFKNNRSEVNDVTVYVEVLSQECQTLSIPSTGTTNQPRGSNTRDLSSADCKSKDQSSIPNDTSTNFKMSSPQFQIASLNLPEQQQSPSDLINFYEKTEQQCDLSNEKVAKRFNLSSENFNTEPKEATQCNSITAENAVQCDLKNEVMCNLSIKNTMIHDLSPKVSPPLSGCGARQRIRNTKTSPPYPLRKPHSPPSFPLTKEAVNGEAFLAKKSENSDIVTKFNNSKCMSSEKSISSNFLSRDADTIELSAICDKFSSIDKTSAPSFSTSGPTHPESSTLKCSNPQSSKVVRNLMPDFEALENAKFSPSCVTRTEDTSSDVTNSLPVLLLIPSDLVSGPTSNLDGECASQEIFVSEVDRKSELSCTPVNVMSEQSAEHRFNQNFGQSNEASPREMSNKESNPSPVRTASVGTCTEPVVNGAPNRKKVIGNVIQLLLQLLIEDGVDVVELQSLTGLL